MSSIEERYVKKTTEQSIMEKDWAAGSSERTELQSDVVIDGKLINTKITYSPKLYKCVDEVVVNALDHMVNCWLRGGKSHVTRITIGLDRDGMIWVENDGPGIETGFHRVEKMHVPQLIFGCTWAGSNSDKPLDSITGGTNGIGAKVANIMSDKFIVETTSDGTYYHQVWTNNMEKVESPTIIDQKKNRGAVPAEKWVPHTRISFRPSYDKFGYDLTDDAVFTEFENLLITRTYYAAVYAGSISHPVKVFWKNQLISCNSVAALAQMMYEEDQIITTSLGKIPRGTNHLDIQVKKGSKTITIPVYEWQLAVAVAEGGDKTIKNMRQTSIVNGIVVAVGCHLDFIKRRLIESIKERIEKTTKSKTALKSETLAANLHIFLCCKIPAVSWNGQAKETLSLAFKDVKTYFDNYVIPPAFISKVAEKLEAVIADSLGEKTTKRRRTVIVDKYERAVFSSDPKKCRKCCLILTEGDSAASRARKGMTEESSDGKPIIGFNYYGLYTLGGVIQNVRRLVKKIMTPTGVKFIISDKLKKSDFWKNFIDITNLDPSLSYDPASPTYEKEMATLNYGGGIIGLVDQDLDGVGKIFGLVLNIFEYIWPKLIENGFVKRFATPLQRAYPKAAGGLIEEFYSNAEFEKWQESNDASKYTIHYIKGLATHTDDEVIHMFKNFEKNLYTYTMEDVEKSRDLFYTYYDVEADLRKEVLSTPPRDCNNDLLLAQRRKMKIDIVDHIEDEVKAYERSDLLQKLWCVVDGMNQSGRKILDAGFKYFGPKSQPVKVQSFAGTVKELCNYHHGQVSIEDSIKGKAFLAVGGVQLPQFQPYGEFGTRNHGGKDAGQSRYIGTKLNYRLVSIIYPQADYHILQFTFEDGKRGEPKYFIPIIPMALVESTEIPSHGWKISVWAKDAIDVIGKVRARIRDEHLDDPSMKWFTEGYTGKIRFMNGSPYSFGRYTYDKVKNTIHVTELPLRVWTTPWYNHIVGIGKKKKSDDKQEKIEARKYVDPNKCANHSGKNVNVQIALTPGGYEAICAEYARKRNKLDCDPIEDYFGLRSHMVSHLNMIGTDGEVVELCEYGEIFNYWYPLRRNLFKIRIERQIILTRLKIIMIKNCVRYISEGLSEKIKKKSGAEVNKILTDHKFDRIYSEKLNNPGFIPNDELEAVILHGRLDTANGEDLVEKDSDDDQLGRGATYRYLLRINDLQRITHGIEKRQAELRKMEDLLATLTEQLKETPFPGAQHWLSELDRLESVIREGRETDWMFSEKNRNKFK